jgi:hypothetical protein
MGTEILLKSLQKHISNLKLSKYVPVSTPKKPAPALAQPTKPLPTRNNTLVPKSKVNMTAFPQGTLSVSKHPPGVFQGIGEHHPGHPQANRRPNPFVHHQQQKQQQMQQQLAPIEK